MSEPDAAYISDPRYCGEQTVVDGIAVTCWRPAGHDGIHQGELVEGETTYGWGAAVNLRTDSVRCPKCDAQPGKPCMTPSGVVRYDYPHLARKKEWEKVRALVPLAIAMAKSGAANRV